MQFQHFSVQPLISDSSKTGVILNYSIYHRVNLESTSWFTAPFSKQFSGSIEFFK